MNHHSKRIAALSPERRALLKSHLQKEGGQFRSFPLSFSQERLWFLEQLDPGNPGQNIPMAVRLSGRLGIPALESALKEVINRHEILRTNFIEVDGRPLQVVAISSDFHLSTVDLRDVAADEQEAMTPHLIQADVRRPFDLELGPLLRAKLLVLGEDRHLLSLTVHHIVSDGWSAGVLFREIALLYQAFIHGHPSPLAVLSVQYSDYAIWQRQWFQGRVLEEQLAYWKQRLENAPGLFEIETDHPRSLAKQHRKRRCPFTLSKSLTAALTALSRQEGGTLFMTLLGALNVLLYRHTYQEDLLIAIPVANRRKGAIEMLIGCFINLLVMRTDLTGNPTFRELLGRVREIALGAYSHQDLPFEILVEEVQPHRDLSRAPLAQVMCVLQNAPMPEVTLPYLKLTPLEVDNGVTRFDLLLSMRESESLTGSLQYDAELFDEPTIARMVERWRCLLAGIVADPDQPIATLPLLPPSELRQVLSDFNETYADSAPDQCLHQLIETQAARTPDRVAVSFVDDALTYEELNARANQLARHLRLRGVGPEVVVGIMASRSLEMVVGLLGILKAGGAYLPLDLSSPKERLRFLLEDSQTAVLLTQRSLLVILPEHKAQVIDLDSDWDFVATQSRENLNAVVESDHLAYVIYTSGSTGRPKGVQIQHRGLTNILDWMWRQQWVTSHDLLVAVTTIAFDIAGVELYLPLLGGARVQLASHQSAADPAALTDLIEISGATVLQMTPAAYQLLLANGWQGHKHLKLMCGGESLPRELAAQLLESSALLLNMYGPTETTIWSTVSQVALDGKVVIGAPIANTEVYVLDEQLQSTPVGVGGQLWIGGAGLARGYLRRPELTAERFIPHPYSILPGARLYRSGDRGRWRGDGQLEFLGRLDRQVKVRGHRVELGEVEAVLREHPCVRDCIVIESGEQGESRLVGYLIAKGKVVLELVELRRYLRMQLPEYMVPVAWVMLKQWPLTANGKVDRRALPKPQSRSEVQVIEEEQVRSPMEELVAGVWCEVLRLKEVGRGEGFFDLGGHSLLAMQVISRVREIVGRKLSLRLIFEHPTVAGMAEQIERERKSESGVRDRGAGPKLRRRAGERREAALSYAQERLWFLGQLVPRSAFYNLPLGMRVKGALKVEALRESLNEVMKRHEVLRTSFMWSGNGPVQVIAEEMRSEMPEIEVRGMGEKEKEEEIERLMREEGERTFELGRGPLIRGQVVRVGEEEWVVLVTMHHIVSDGWSMGVLARELEVMYREKVGGKSAGLKELPIQYADYAEWQREWLQGEVLQEQVAFWKDRLAGALPALELPTGRERPASPSYRGANQSFELRSELTRQLERLSRSEGVTLFMVLLAAFKTLLYRYTGQQDIIVGTGVANRSHPETEGLIGFFVNMLALRTDLSGNPTFKDLLHRVRKTTLDAYVHQDLPFDRLVEELHLKRDLSRAPVFQVVLVLQNVPFDRIELPGLTVTPLKTHRETSYFDLTMTLGYQEQRLAGSLEYNTDLYDAIGITKMLDHFRVLLERFAENPGRRIDISLDETSKRDPNSFLPPPKAYAGDQFGFELG
jgi:amino acid adenylation domain-containing protein